MQSEAEFILLGVISGAHGIKGHVIITSYTAPITNIINFNLQDQSANLYKLIKIRQISVSKLVCRLIDCNDRTKAENLIGTRLYCAKSVLPKVRLDEFYFADLEGKIILDIAGREIGKVSGIFNFGAGDLVEVTFKQVTNQQKIVRLYPFTKEFFPQINQYYMTLDKDKII